MHIDKMNKDGNTLTVRAVKKGLNRQLRYHFAYVQHTVLLTGLRQKDPT